MKEKCIKCKGIGLTDEIEIHGRNYKVICDRCFGLKEVYWTENLMPKSYEKNDSFDMFECATRLEHTFEPDNYIIPAPGRTYYLREEFFYCQDDMQEKYRNLIMTLNDYE